MFSIRQSDQRVTYAQQVREENFGTLVLVNIFHLRPGFLSVQFYQGSSQEHLRGITRYTSI